MRLDKYERRALKNALRDFDGTVHISGSRLYDTKKSEDIDILLLPKEKKKITWKNGFVALLTILKYRFVE